MSDRAIEKVRIIAYKDRNFAANSVVTPSFDLPMNPENYSKNFKIESDNRRGHGNQGTDPRYNSTAPEELKLEFIFDGTGAIENYRYPDTSDKSVKRQLALFLKTVYQMEGSIHRPNFLKLHWGEYLIFPCILSNLDINYQLFEPNGDPLRVRISATFLNYIAQEERTARERRNSPDLTHLRQAKADDRLDLMTYHIYNDTKYLLQIARANNLPTIRQLKPGSELRFPPIDKPESA
jgi:hypothetical protein